MNIHLQKEWHPTKNKTLTFEKCKVSKNVWWKCPKSDDHEWMASINKRKGRGDGCPFCSGHKACRSNSFGFLFPSLANELHSTLNIEFDKFSVTPGSHKKVWWQCSVEHDHIWQTSVKDRTLRNSGCPCCGGKKVVKSNSLLTRHPNLSKEWHPTKNSNSPNDVYAGGHKKVWWICDKGHQWKTEIKTRIAGHGCPICNESKGERKIKDFLENKKISFTREYKFPDLRRVRLLKFDFAMTINNQIAIIEYHGQQHYMDSIFFGGTDAYNKRKICDDIKIEYCQNKKIPFIVIPYWDYDEIENELEKFISSI